jgi:N-acetylglucosamine-6-phosphate deacetylase
LWDAAEGEFELSGVPCIVEDGVAKLLDRSAFAGSVATTDRLVRTVVRAGIPLCDAIKMMTETPAKIMGLSNVGKLSVGYDADIVIFDEDINVNTVISKGNIVKG